MVVGPQIFHGAEWAIFGHLMMQHRGFLDSMYGAQFKQVLALEGREREELEVCACMKCVKQAHMNTDLQS